MVSAFLRRWRLNSRDNLRNSSEMKLRAMMIQTMNYRQQSRNWLMFNHLQPHSNIFFNIFRDSTSYTRIIKCRSKDAKIVKNQSRIVVCKSMTKVISFKMKTHSSHNIPPRFIRQTILVVTAFHLIQLLTYKRLQLSLKRRNLKEASPKRKRARMWRLK